MNANIEKELLSVQETAQHLGVSESTVRRYISDGRLPAYRLGDERLIRIKREDLQGLLSPIEIDDAQDQDIGSAPSS